MICHIADLPVARSENFKGGEGHVLMKDLSCGKKPANFKVCCEMVLEKGCSIGFHVHEGDGEIICNCTIPYRIGDPFPEGVFVDLLELTARAGLSQYSKLKAYAEGELDDEEIDAFLTWLPSAREMVENRERVNRDQS